MGGGLTSVIPMTFNIPDRVWVVGIILLIAANLDLLKAPGRQMNIGRNEVTTKALMLEPHTGRQAAHIGNLLPTAENEVGVNLDNPVVTCVPDSGITVPGDLIVLLRDGRGDCMRMQIA